MLDPDEERSVAAAFGVATSQVRRDHLISHVLAALSERFADRLLFFGGTALSRTHVSDGRLSEDIDLIALDSRTGLAADLDTALPRALRREFPGSAWRPALSEVRDEAEPASLIGPDGTTVRVQLLRRTGYPPWPTERRELVQRYSDADPAALTVPTLASFVAWRTAAWIDRAAPRRVPHAGQFATAPDEETWRRALASQTRLRISAVDALATVRAAWQRLTP